MLQNLPLGITEWALLWITIEIEPRGMTGNSGRTHEKLFG